MDSEDDEFEYFLELDENQNVKFYFHDTVSVNIFSQCAEI